jgi:hypothetical protein
VEKLSEEVKKRKKVDLKHQWFVNFFQSKESDPQMQLIECRWCTLSCAGHFFCGEKAHQVTSMGNRNGKHFLPHFQIFRQLLNTSS